MNNMAWRLYSISSWIQLALSSSPSPPAMAVSLSLSKSGFPTPNGSSQHPTQPDHILAARLPAGVVQIPYIYILTDWSCTECVKKCTQETHQGAQRPWYHRWGPSSTQWHISRAGNSTFQAHHVYPSACCTALGTIGVNSRTMHGILWATLELSFM